MRILWVNTVYGYPSYLEPGIPVFFIFKAKAPFTIVGSTCFNIFFFSFFIPRYTIVAGYYGFTLDVRVSARRSVVRWFYVQPSIFRFRVITWVNINRFSPNLVCALILWRSGLGLLMGEFCQILTELTARMAGYYSLTFLFIYFFFVVFQFLYMKIRLSTIITLNIGTVNCLTHLS